MAHSRLMRQATIRLVVTDLDNTLYDWFAAFVPAFYAMVRAAVSIVGVDEDELLDDLQAVHRRHGNSEHPFALLEARCIDRALSQQSRAQRLVVLDPAFHAFNRTRKANLRLYETVFDALERLHQLEVPVVAYTDARVFNSRFRLQGLGIDKLLHRLYAPAPMVDTKRVDTERVARARDEFVHLLPASDRKPNPQTLRDICSEYDVAGPQVLYIGDSLVRDVYMAKMAGSQAAWAKFGTLYDRALWQQLVRVTHWTDADVEREQQLRQDAAAVKPDCTLDRFDDIFRHYRFVGLHS